MLLALDLFIVFMTLLSHSRLTNFFDLVITGDKRLSGLLSITYPSIVKKRSPVAQFAAS
jgi:hypothetical protein